MHGLDLIVKTTVDEPVQKYHSKRIFWIFQLLLVKLGKTSLSGSVHTECHDRG